MHAQSISSSCLQCGVAFAVAAWRIRKGQGKYCSRVCAYAGRKKIAVGKPTCCHRCKREDPPEGFHSNGYCKTCSNAYSAQWRAEHHDQALATQRRHWQRHREEKVANSKRWRDAVRDAVFERYGRCCACCGEAEPSFLVIDHIAGGGNEHRRSLGSFRGNLYAWLRVNGYPGGFRTLCANCNMALGSRGSCVHGGVEAVAVRVRGRQPKEQLRDLNVRTAGYAARPVEPRICPQCRASFTPKYHADLTVYCSNTCAGLAARSEACSLCGATGIPLQSNHYCRPCDAARKREARHRANMRLLIK